ncbi:hypothetical protein JKY79_03410 [Candidatus Babeliales bacterium]|nr:hypothetical protein [Candidatus Babeliales bacterium]
MFAKENAISIEAVEPVGNIKIYIPTMANLSYGLENNVQIKQKILSELCEQGQKLYLLFEKNKLVGYVIFWIRPIFDNIYFDLNFVLNQFQASASNQLVSHTVYMCGVVPIEGQKVVFARIEQDFKEILKGCRVRIFNNLAPSESIKVKGFEEKEIIFAPLYPQHITEQYLLRYERTEHEFKVKCFVKVIH